MIRLYICSVLVKYGYALGEFNKKNGKKILRNYFLR